MLPAGRVLLARTPRGPAQAHGRGRLAPAHRGGTRPLTRTRGPRGRRPPVDPHAPAGPQFRRAPVARICALTPIRRHALQSPQHHASPTGGRAGARQSPPPSAGGSRPGPSSGRGDGGARGAHCRPARPDGQCKDFPQRGRFPGRPRPERSRGPYAAPGDAPDFERGPAGANQPGGGPLRTLNGVAHVQPVRPAPVHGGHLAADGRGIRHVPPQQRPSPAARPQDALPRGHGPVPEPGAGHIPRRSVRAGRGTPPPTSAGRGPGGGRNHGVRERRGRGAHPPPPDKPVVRRHQAAPCTPSCARRSPGSPPGAPHSRWRRAHPAAGPTRTYPPLFPGTGVPTTEGRSSLSECLFFSIDPQHFVDGSTSSAGYSVIGENLGLFKFWSLPRSFLIITSIPEARFTPTTFQLTPSRLFVHPENIMNFTLFGSSKAADDGLSTLFNHSPSHLFQKHQASNLPLQTRFPSRQFEAVEGKIFDTRRRIFVPKLYRRLQDYSKFYLDVEGTDIQSAFVGSNSTDILDRGSVSSVAHNNYNELAKLLFEHKRFYLKPYELDYSQTEAKKSPPTATPWAKQLRTVLDKAKEAKKDLKGWFVIPAWDAQVVAATFRMPGSTCPFSTPPLHF